MKSVGIARTLSGGGYWIVDDDGSVSIFGDAAFYGSMGGQPLNEPMVGITASPTGLGYWLVASDGGVFSFGDAGFHGSLGGQHLNHPIPGMAGTPSGAGYWLVASDGAISAFGDAAAHGSMAGQHLNRPMVGMASSRTGQGYWTVAADGGVFSFGDAAFHGSMGGQHLNRPMVGMAATPTGLGYWLVAADGGVFSFGDAAFYGSMGGQHLNQPMVGMAATPTGLGYWLVAADGGIFAFGDAGFLGNSLLEVHEEHTCVILCRFRNPDGSLSPVMADRDFYEQFFFGRHIGGSLRDFYSDVTHGHLTLVGTVFGWLDIGHTIAEHVALKDGGSAQRAQAFTWAKTAAINAGIDVDSFARQVVIINQDTDWGAVPRGRAMLLPHSPTSAWSHSRAAHEFGHVLDLNEAYQTSVTAGVTVDTAYLDEHCIMSYATTGYRYQLNLLGDVLETGPGLNGVYVNRLGGIPANRTYAVPADGAALTLTLAPLTHADEDGVLLVKIPPGTGRPNTYWVELHDKSHWDRAIPRARIAVHETRNSDDPSYLLDVNGLQSLDSPATPALITPDGSIGIRYVQRVGLNVSVRIWELGPSKTLEVRIASIVARPGGGDPLKEHVVIRNDRPTTAVLTNWVLRDDFQHPVEGPWTFVFPNVSLAPGEDLVVWTGDGVDDAHNLFWRSPHAVWNDRGDTGVLLDDAGTEVSRLNYRHHGK